MRTWTTIDRKIIQYFTLQDPIIQNDVIKATLVISISRVIYYLWISINAKQHKENKKPCKEQKRKQRDLLPESPANPFKYTMEALDEKDKSYNFAYEILVGIIRLRIEQKRCSIFVVYLFLFGIFLLWSTAICGKFTRTTSNISFRICAWQYATHRLQCTCNSYPVI